MKRAAMHSKSLFVVLGSCPEHVRLLVLTVCPEKLGSSRKLPIIFVTRNKTMPFK